MTRHTYPLEKTLLCLSGLVVAGVTLLPVVWLFFMSFKTKDEIFGPTPTFVPHDFSLTHYAYVLFQTDYAQYALNSVIIAVATTIVVMVPAIPSGYGYSKFFRFKGQGALLLFVLISRMLPPIAIVVPLYEVFSGIHLLGTKLGLVLISAALSFPLATWMLKTFFEYTPHSIVEAATIDGCNRVSALWYIVLPLSKSAIASTTTITFLTVWNLFLIPLVFSTTANSKTLPVAISELAYGEYGTAWGALAALSVIMIIPVALMGIFAQRYLTAGLTAGAEKG